MPIGIGVALSSGMSNPTNPAKTARLAKDAREVATHCAAFRAKGLHGLARAIERANRPLTGAVNTYGATF